MPGEEGLHPTFFERKIMSTKTKIKRVAFVAATALTFAGISGVAAHAAGSDTFTIAGATTGTGYQSASATSSATVGTYVSVAVTFTGDTNNADLITSTGSGSIVVPSIAPAASGTGATLATTGITSTSATVFNPNSIAAAVPGGQATPLSASGTFTFSAYSAAAGTQTISIVGSGGTSTATINWGAATTVSAANSIVAANNATDIAASTTGTTAGNLKVTTSSADSSLSASSAINTPAGGAYVALNNNASSTSPVTTDIISATVSGPGLLTITPVTFTGTTVNLGTASLQGRTVATAAATPTALVKILADGTSGVSTVTISDSTTGTVIGSFSVTFYGSTVGSLSAKTNTAYLPAATVTGFTPTATEALVYNGSTGHAVSSSTSEAAVSFVAKDSSGNVIPGVDGSLNSTSFTFASSNTAVASVNATNAYYDSTNGYWYPIITPVSEGAATITVADASTGKITATAVINVSAAVASTVSTSTDASNYAPGTKVVYTISAKDAAGNPVADGTYGTTVSTASAPTTTSFLTTLPSSNFGLQGSVASASGDVTFANGTSTSTLYAPLSGPVTIGNGVLNASASYLATALQGSTLPAATFTVTTDTSAADAASLAVDSANAATDAANAAAESADNATQAATDALSAVQDLQAQVTKLFAALKAQISAISKALTAKSTAKKK